MAAATRAAHTSCRTLHRVCSRTCAAARRAGSHPEWTRRRRAGCCPDHRPCNSRLCGAPSCTPPAMPAQRGQRASRLVDDVAGDERLPHASGELIAEERRVLALALQVLRRDAERRRRVEDRDVGGSSNREAVLGDAEYARRVRGNAGQRLRERELACLAPFQREGQEALKAGGTRLGPGERQALAILGGP